jgi:hypothetical protein
VALGLAGLAYWRYVYQLTHGQKRALPAVSLASTATAAAVPASAASAAALPASLKNATEAGITALGNYVAQTVKISPAGPEQTGQTLSAPSPQATPPPVTASVAKPQIETLATPVVVQTPPKYQTRVRPPQERLLRAGQVAFGNVMDAVNKHPDAYGFGPEDVYKDARLGEPIPVYTIAEADRAKYQAGQNVKPLLKPANLWVFPILMGDRVCCMAQVKYTGRDYVPDKGSKSLAVAWNMIQERWPASEGYHPCLVIKPGIPGYYFTIPELATPNMTDIVQLSLFDPSLSPADVILASWR